MTTSIKFDKYLFNLAKRNDSCLTITAQTELESSLFESQPIELKRIKFDTVVAALSKQNEKNLISKANINGSKGRIRGWTEEWIGKVACQHRGKIRFPAGVLRVDHLD